MKRRNADCGKIRRPIKRNKIAEGMYGSTTILYMKFLILWAIVITADFMFMFRFEFLWPFWLLLRSVHDSFKYKGLAFSVLFVCIAITSDLVCLFFIPVHWLLFAASTYVWVQYVWHTDKGICLPTIILWMLFVYLEAGIRWKDSRHMPHLDLCRPFAAHCIGYPVVTLGFGFKSYVGYRMRQRKQREVAKENEFYMQLLQQALPQDETMDDVQGLAANGSIVVSTSNGTAITTSSILSSGSCPIAQTVQMNSLTGDHHHSSQSDESNHARHLTQLNSNHTSPHATQTIAATMLPNSHQPHHNHHFNSNNTSNSSNKNAQTNSKLNHLSNNSTTATANGHVTTTLNGLTTTTSNSTSRNQRRSVDKEKNDTSQGNHLIGYTSTNSSNRSTNNSATSGANNSTSDPLMNGNSSKSLFASNTSYLNQLSNIHLPKEAKDKENWDSCASSTSSSISLNSSTNSTKENKSSNSYELPNGHHAEKKNQSNGSVVHYEVEELEKVKGRRNRSKRDTTGSSKDNHTNYNSYTSQQSNSNHNSNHQQQQNKDSTTSLDSTSASSSSSTSLSSSSSTILAANSATVAATISNTSSQIISKVCEACLRFEAEIKKYRSEISHMKQIENELRQKLESNAINKSCLQVKQRENDELDKRIQELTSCRQMDVINLQNVERRLADERRQRQSLESLLNNEKKARKIAEEKANRTECSEQCKQRKMQIEQEIKQLRRESKSNEDAKQAAEQQGRKFEQELRMLEVEVRNREAQQGTEVLMSALAAMQDKNSTLEKNLSAETRVKLDLFSALGEAKRQLEIKDSLVRSKDEEVLDLKAKIAQLLAVMPTDSLCLQQCSTAGSSMLRINDTPPLQGPASPMMSLGGPTHQQLLAAAAAHQQQQQMNSRVANSSSNGMSPNVVTVVTSASGCSNVGQSMLTQAQQTSSNLDPNAIAYTPKNSSLVGGAEA